MNDTRILKKYFQLAKSKGFTCKAKSRTVVMKPVRPRVTRTYNIALTSDGRILNAWEYPSGQVELLLETKMTTVKEFDSLTNLGLLSSTISDL